MMLPALCGPTALPGGRWQHCITASTLMTSLMRLFSLKLCGFCCLRVLNLILTTILSSLSPAKMSRAQRGLASCCCSSLADCLKAVNVACKCGDSAVDASTGQVDQQLQSAAACPACGHHFCCGSPASMISSAHLWELLPHMRKTSSSSSPSVLMEQVHAFSLFGISWFPSEVLLTSFMRRIQRKQVCSFH